MTKREPFSDAFSDRICPKCGWDGDNWPLIYRSRWVFDVVLRDEKEDGWLEVACRRCGWFFEMDTLAAAVAAP